MAESIKFTDIDRSKTLAIPEAQQFLIDGVINPASEDWTKLSKETQISILDECAKLSEIAQKGCNDLRAELEKSVSKPQATSEKQKSEIPAEIKSVADATRTKINTVFGDPKSMDFHHYLSVWRRIKSVIPGNEVSTIKDVEDVKNQSYEYINGLVDYLESESSNDKMEMNLSALPWDQAPGWYPTTDVTKFSNPQDKQAKIKEIMEKINKSLEGESAW
jgi:hypothetical protein